MGREQQVKHRSGVTRPSFGDRIVETLPTQLFSGAVQRSTAGIPAETITYYPAVALSPQDSPQEKTTLGGTDLKIDVSRLRVRTETGDLHHSAREDPDPAARTMQLASVIENRQGDSNGTSFAACCADGMLGSLGRFQYETARLRRTFA